MRAPGRFAPLSVGLLAVGIAAGLAPQAPRGNGKKARLQMSTPVACKKVRGFGQYDPLPGAALTRDEKLLIYFEPRNFGVAKVKDSYQAHLSVDGRLRRLGRKEVLRKDDKAVEYKPKGPGPDLPPIYMMCVVSLKGLEPGPYEIDLILHDEVDPKQPPTTETLEFRVKPSKPSKAEPGRGEGPKGVVPDDDDDGGDGP